MGTQASKGHTHTHGRTEVVIERIKSLVCWPIFYMQPGKEVRKGFLEKESHELGPEG